MKRFTLLAIQVALLSVTAFAQKGMNQPLIKGKLQKTDSKLEMKAQPVRPIANVSKDKKFEMKKLSKNKIQNSISMSKVKGLSSNSQAVKAPKRIAAADDVLVTPPETATQETWYTVDGGFYVNTSSGWADRTSSMGSITVAIDGDDIYIQGLAYFFEDAWIKGTISSDEAIFANSQYLGSDSYGPEYLVGSDDGESLSENIVFSYDAEQGILESATTYIFENGKEDELYYYSYWELPTFSVEAPEGPELVTPPETATVETYYTFDGAFNVYYQSDWMDITEYMPSVNVAIDGNDIYVQGLAFYFEESWIKGTISGDQAIFENGQYVGTDAAGPEYLVGSQDGSSVADNIVFDFDPEKGILSSTDYITESASQTSLDIYSYWAAPMFMKNPPQLVTPPEDLVTEEYLFSYVDDEGESHNSSVNVGFDGNNVYIQGFSSFVPEGWIVGTLEGNTITFSGGQYLGDYIYYKILLQDEDVVFTYDADADKMTNSETIYTFTLEGYTADEYSESVIFKVKEVAGTPSTPEITEIYESAYGPIAYFNIPIVDVEGNAMLTSKLTYQIFSEVDHVANVVTFDPEEYEELTEAMTVIPYGFTDDYDFYPDHIYLNMETSSWNRIGIQTTYTGGGEENKSEIFWYTLKEYEYAMGDVNHDNSVSLQDILLVVDAILSNDNSGLFMEQADSDGDGKLSLSDILAIVDIILNNGGSGQIDEPVE